MFQFFMLRRWTHDFQLSLVIGKAWHTTVLVGGKQTLIERPQDIVEYDTLFWWTDDGDPNVFLLPYALLRSLRAGLNGSAAAVTRLAARLADRVACCNKPAARLADAVPALLDAPGPWPDRAVPAP